MTKSLWKYPPLQFTKKSDIHKIKRTWNRQAFLIKKLLKHNFEIHNGIGYAKIHVVKDMVGHRLGEFSLTRCKYQYMKKKRKKKYK